MYRNETQIKLLNTYRGLPISYDAKISLVNETEVHVTSNKMQIACLYHQRETFIQNEKLPFTIRSQVMSLNLAKEDAALSDFEVAENNIGKRMNIRVEPEGILIGVIQFKGYPTKVIAPIFDISIYGVSVHIEDFLFPARICQPGSEISMTITIPESAIQKPKKVLASPLADNKNNRSLVRSTLPLSSDRNIEINAWGKILAVRPEPSQSRYRVGIKLYIKDQERMLVSQFISLRQAEIIRDLRILSDELYNRKK